MAILDDCATLHRACFTELQCDLQVKVYEQNQKLDQVSALKKVSTN